MSTLTDSIVYTSTTFVSSLSINCNISVSSSGGLSKLAIPSEINSLLSGHSGHSNKYPTITPAPSPLLITISKRRSARCGSEETPIFVQSRVENRRGHGYLFLFEQIGEMFGSVDLAVRTAFPLTSHLSTLTAPSSSR